MSDPDITTLDSLIAGLQKAIGARQGALDHADGAAYYRDKAEIARLTGERGSLHARRANAVQRRKRDLRLIHAAAREIGMPKDAYRSRVKGITKGRTDSAGDCTAVERAALIASLKDHGWKPAGGRRYSPESRDKPRPDKDQADKIRALWIELGNAGKVRRPTEQALGSYCQRMAGKASPGWLTQSEASVIIEALKAWLARPEPEAE